jgi:AcrR family transcriptional regulator
LLRLVIVKNPWDKEGVMNSIRKKPKGAYQHGNLKESLLKAAFAVIKKTHQADFSLRELARTVGVTPMAAYRHFPSKEAILLEMASQGFLLLGERFQKALSVDPADLQALGKAYVEFAVENPVYFRVMFHPDLHSNPGKFETRPEDKRAYQLLMDCVARNQTMGRFQNPNTEELAITAWSTVHGLASLIVNRNLENKYVVDEKTTFLLIENTTQIILDGLKNG